MQQRAMKTQPLASETPERFLIGRNEARELRGVRVFVHTAWKPLIVICSSAGQPNASSKYSNTYQSVYAYQDGLHHNLTAVYL
jgi:hypothetical protein